MTDYEDKDDIWVWEYGCKATQSQMNDAFEFCKATPESREISRLKYQMDWYREHGTVEQVGECADKIHTLERKMFTIGKKYCMAKIENNIPEGL